VQEKVDFGNSLVSPEKKTKLVREVFDNVANQYDLMNDLMSFGLHRVWKRILLEKTSIRPNSLILDLAGGTGDISLLATKLVGPDGKIVLADINFKMLDKSRDRIIDIGSFENIELCQCNAEYLPFPNNSFNRVIMSFGLRNVTNKHYALSEIFRVLKKGGRLCILEFSKPKEPLNRLVAKYNSFVLPVIGQFITKNSEAYRYLAESIERHPDQNTLASMILKAGFNSSEFVNISNGIVAIHSGYKQ